MPASLPGATLAQNQGNPSQGVAVTFDALTGAKGALRDTDQTGNQSTGAMSTGLGLTPNTKVPGITTIGKGTNYDKAGYVPGVTKPDGTASADSTILYIGGGRSNANSNGMAVNDPYTAGFGIAAAGNGATRDVQGGVDPNFYASARSMELAVAAADVDNNALLTAGFNNNSGVKVPSGAAQFGVAIAAGAEPA